MNNLLIFRDDQGLLDEEEFVRFIKTTGFEASMNRRGVSGNLVSFVFSHGGEDVTLELKDGLNAVVVHGVGLAAFEVVFRFNEFSKSDLRVIDQYYTFDVLVGDFDSGGHLESISNT